MNPSTPHGLFVVLLVIGAAGANIASSDGTNTVNEPVDDAVRQVMVKECKTGYSPLCLKLGLMRLVSRGGGMTIPVFPGVSISSTRALNQTPDPSAADIESDPEVVDDVLMKKLGDFLGSLSLNVKVMDKSTPMGIAKAFLGDTATARKKQYGGMLAAAGLMSGGTMLALGLAALAAMSGKALMASLLALMLAALAALKGGGGGEKTTYEVIAKPVVSHIATHSSEIQHGHGHYRRSLDAHQLAYGTQ